MAAVLNLATVTGLDSSRRAVATAGHMMSAVGQEQTSLGQAPMSASPPKADMDQQGCDIRFVPISLQKSGTTGHRGWRERLEQAAYLSSP